MVRFLVAFFVLALSVAVGHASDIRLIPYKGLQVITIFGEINPDDYKQFQRIAIPLDNALVLLGSPGGSTYAAIQIGRTISIKGFSTFVGAQSTCASSCGLIWLAGRIKLISSSARVGFHASYEMDAGKAETSGAGNALVGSYLRQLGFSDDAIIYMTSKSPDSMQWMNLNDAERLGINVRVVQDTDSFASAGAAAKAGQANTSNGDNTVGTRPNEPGLGISEPPAQKPDWKVLNNVDLPGHDLADMPIEVGSVKLCEAVCSTTTGCQAFTFNSQYNACFLKGSVGKALQYTGAISGYRQDRLAAPVAVGSAVGRLQNFRTSEGVEILGRNVWDFRNKTLSWCQDQCVASQMCQGFTFYRGGRCVFKDHTKPTRARADAVSGIKMQ